ncbi:hypothetical protein ACTFIR_003880 [Dictyostelium discoideum]
MAKNIKEIIDNNSAENAPLNGNKVGDILVNLPKEHTLIQLQKLCAEIEYICASSANALLQSEWKKANMGLFPFGGTIMSLVIVLNGYCFCINIGDSRAVLVTDSAIEQLTQDAFPSDHSFTLFLSYESALKRALRQKIADEVAFVAMLVLRAHHEIQSLSKEDSQKKELSLNYIALYEKKALIEDPQFLKTQPEPRELVWINLGRLSSSWSLK